MTVRTARIQRHAPTAAAVAAAVAITVAVAVAEGR